MMLSESQLAYKIHSVHTKPEEIENAAPFILQLGLPSTLIGQENETFRKRSSKGEFENAGFSLSRGLKIF